MKAKQILSLPGNRKAALVISQQVLAQIAPDETMETATLVEPLIDMAGKGEVVTIDTSDQAGSFGGADLMVIVVVPAVVTLITNLLTEFGKAGIEELREIAKRKEEAKTLLKVTVGDVEAVVRRTKSAKGKKRTKELVQAINAALVDYLEN